MLGLIVALSLGTAVVGCSGGSESATNVEDAKSINNNLKGMPEVDKSKFSPMGNSMKKGAR